MDFSELNLLNWGLTIIAMFLVGMGKAGIKGIGIISVLLLATIFGGKASTGILMPMMVIADVFAVSYYHRHTQWGFLKKLLPMMVVGVLVGVWWGNDISEALFKNVMAVLILITVVVMVIMERTKHIGIPKHWSFSSSMGLISGFTSMIGNLAGSFSNIYFLAMRLPKNEFIGRSMFCFRK